MPTVLVFTGSLLPASETFIDQHARSLQRFDSVLVGLKKVAGIATDPAKTCLLSLNLVQKFALYFWGVCPPLDKIVKDRGVVLLHAHFLDNGLLLARYAARKRLPLLITLHGADVLRHPAAISLRRRVFRHLLHKTLLKVATRFLPVSDYLAAECEKLGYPAAKLTRHYLGIRLAQSDVAQANPTNRTVLFVGRLVEKKGIAYLAGAIETLVRQGNGVRGVFVGTGPLDGYLRNIARDRNLPIELRGALPHAAVLEEMKAAAIFCMPSTQAADGDNEGLGLVFLEAQMLGVPVVAFRQGPVPEAVIDGETGLLATDRNAQDLARALTTLLGDPGLRQRMGRNGQQFVRTTFDLTQQAGRLEDIYDAVLRERTAPAGLGQTVLKNH